MSDDIECPLTANPCRFCSVEKTYRPYMKIEKDPESGIFKPMGLGKIEVNLGHRCNNYCRWVDEMGSCPLPDDLIHQQEMIEENIKLKEKEKVKEERRKAREKAARLKPTGEKSIKKTVTKPVKKIATKGVTKRKL